MITIVKLLFNKIFTHKYIQTQRTNYSLLLTHVETCTRCKLSKLTDRCFIYISKMIDKSKWSVEKRIVKMKNNDFMYILKLLVVCMMWYISSASGNVIGKLVLNEFPYPMTMTMVQLASAAIYLGPILKMLDVPTSAEIKRRYYLIMIVPLAFGKFVSSVSSHISIWKVSVSYAHTGL